MFCGLGCAVVLKESIMNGELKPGDPAGANARRIRVMMAATSDPFYLEQVPKHISLAVQEPRGPELMRTDARLREVILMIEHIKCDQPAPAYTVYLNVPPGDEPAKHPELSVDEMSMFGLLEASTPDPNHPSDGLTYTFDVTGLYRRLALMPGWDAKNLRISFVPPGWLRFNPKVKVGRVSLYFQ